MSRALPRLALVVALLIAALPAAAGVAGAQGKALSASRVQLPNGLTVLVRENPTAPVVAFSLMTRMGTRSENEGNAGISNFLQLMLVRGTTSKNGVEIIEAAERMGGSLDAYADVDHAEIAATALSRHWSDMLALVADVVLNPTIPEATAGAVKDFLLKQIRNRGDKPYDAGVDFIGRRLYGAHPYGWNPLGRRESVEKLTRDNLVAHYKRFYVPASMVLAVSGRVKADEVLARVRTLFGNMPEGYGPAPALPSPPPLETSRDVIEVAGAQAQILMAGFGPQMVHPDFPAVKVLANVLGGGMSGRFFSELRDKQGLAYTTGALYPARIERPPFVAQIGTAPESAEKSEAALRAELARVQREQVGPEELNVAKAYLLGNLAMDRRTNARQAWYLATYEVAGVGFEFLDRYPDRVRAVTAADVQRVAQRYLAVLRTIVVEPPARP
jgi:predicted Zn-dependent peptidase